VNKLIVPVATITTITNWGNFDSEYSANGGNVSFFYRTGNSLSVMSTQTWSAVTPGNIISANSNRNFVQWAATMTHISTSQASNIDVVSISHVEGSGSDEGSSAIMWNDRYWLSVTTVSESGRRIFYLLSDPDAKESVSWTRFIGINSKTLLKYNDIFYGGSASDGSIYRLDYGSDDNGSPIQFTYETPELYMDNKFLQKTVRQYLFDVTGVSSGTLTFGTSVDGGDYVDQSINISGTTRKILGKKLDVYSNAINKDGYFFRYRLSNVSSSGEVQPYRIQLHGFGLIYEPTTVAP